MAGMVTSESTLKPSAQGRLSTSTRIPLMATARRRLISHLSMLKLMRFSNTAITVESAAKLMKMKNSAPQRLPSGIWANTKGSVTNTSEGPESGVTP